MLGIEQQKKLQSILQEMEVKAFKTVEAKKEHACWSLGISELTKLNEYDLKQYCHRCSTDNCFTRLS